VVMRLDLDHTAMMLRTGNYIFNGVKQSFDRGRLLKPVMKFSNDPFRFRTNYTDIEKALLQNFMVESFTIAGVLDYQLQEKLKELSVRILTDPGLVKDVSGKTTDPKELFVKLASGFISKYSHTGETPPAGYLATDFRTAVTSAWSASYWHKIKGSGIYVAIQYKTREDNRVREAHEKLEDRVWLIDDPIWLVIYPPNDFNCRCYPKPLTAAELTGIESTATESDIEEIVTQGGVGENFRRNSGEVASIYQKWLDSKLEEINWSKVTKDMRDYANKFTNFNTTNAAQVWGTRYFSNDTGKYRTVVTYISEVQNGYEIVQHFDGIKQPPRKIKASELENYQNGTVIWMNR
jgi:Uncharacterized protein, homolog of phage Mu protein gp30